MRRLDTFGSFVGHLIDLVFKNIPDVRTRAGVYWDANKALRSRLPIN